MVQSVTYQSETKTVPFQGKTIVLESLTPVLSPKEKENGKKRLNAVCMRYSANTGWPGTNGANAPQHCCPGLSMV